MVELVQDDIRARMKEDESLVDLRAPMTSTVAAMVASMGASLVAPMASMVVLASMVSMVASMASMVEALDWLRRMTAESKCDNERVDGWIHKIREELTDGLPSVDDVVQVVTWVRTKRVLDGTDDTDSLDCGADGGFDGGYDGGSGGFEPKQRNDNCKRRSRGY